jgi:hypothetical protein
VHNEETTSERGLLADTRINQSRGNDLPNELLLTVTQHARPNHRCLCSLWGRAVAGYRRHGQYCSCLFTVNGIGLVVSGMSPMTRIALNLVGRALDFIVPILLKK